MAIFYIVTLLINNIAYGRNCIIDNSNQLKNGDTGGHSKIRMATPHAYSYLYVTGLVERLYDDPQWLKVELYNFILYIWKTEFVRSIVLAIYIVLYTLRSRQRSDVLQQIRVQLQNQSRFVIFNIRQKVEKIIPVFVCVGFFTIFHNVSKMM